MQYTQKSFTLPASGNQTSQINWDRAFLSAEEFALKYGGRPRAQMTPEEKEAQRQGFAYGNVVLSNPNVTREMIAQAARDMESQGAD